MTKFYQSLIILLSCITISFSSAYAATGYKSILINYTDGTNLLLAIENGMTTEFDNGDILMQSPKGTIAIPTSDVKSFNFSTIPGVDWGTAGIDEVPSEAASIVVNELSVELDNIPASSHISLVNLAGQTVKSFQASGSVSIATGSLANGIYILSINNKSIKIALK